MGVLDYLDLAKQILFGDSSGSVAELARRSGLDRNIFRILRRLVKGKEARVDLSSIESLSWREDFWVENRAGEIFYNLLVSETNFFCI